ncbi:hypothetical protein RRG08_059014 [Elysia crispata]|uniref:Uncharacterized protein n=1 Tax=Elysia crispata TaxID=231223 RepID=A0AAE0ZD44_9GAST|nr:hypothetical protein RRG08_059014 [Elysia crispata]
MDISLPPVMMGDDGFSATNSCCNSGLWSLGSVKLHHDSPYTEQPLPMKGREMVMHCDASVAKVNYGRTVVFDSAMFKIIPERT